MPSSRANIPTSNDSHELALLDHLASLKACESRSSVKASRIYLACIASARCARSRLPVRGARRFPPTWHPIPVHCSNPSRLNGPDRARPFSLWRHTVGTPKTSAHIWRHSLLLLPPPEGGFQRDAYRVRGNARVHSRGQTAPERCASHMRSGEFVSVSPEKTRCCSAGPGVRSPVGREQKQAIAPSGDGTYLFFKLSVVPAK